MLEAYVKKILSSEVYDVAVETPLEAAPFLSTRLNADVSFKREDLQPIHSFKIRGAYNRIVKLGEHERERGVLAASAGNHAQGVALAASRLGIQATIVMGLNAPAIKIEAVQRLGAEVVLRGDTYDDAAQHAQALAARNGATLVSPYDDPAVIAGQGTVGVEILNQHEGDPDAIFVPVGGGGLVAGIAAYVKYLKPRVKIIGVEASGSDCLNQALIAGRRVRLRTEGMDLFADGASVAQVGKRPFQVARLYVDQVIVVTTDEICAAIKDIFDDTRAIAEPAGALAVAGLKRYVESTQGSKRRYVAVISGSNVNFDRLRHISERAEFGERREALLGVSIPEKPGSFRRLCQTLGKRAITEFNYRSNDQRTAQVFLGVRVHDLEERRHVVNMLHKRGYVVDDMTDNEMAKLHVRHMVGGPASSVVGELLYRFEFPERPGALRSFLTEFGVDWNISLFHYRNHGAAWGRVLVGFTAVDQDRRALRKYLDRIGYRYWEESANSAYRMFLV